LYVVVEKILSKGDALPASISPNLQAVTGPRQGRSEAMAVAVS
jgi:hypothetical protein